MIKERFTLADKGKGIEHATSQLRFNVDRRKRNPKVGANALS